MKDGKRNRQYLLHTVVGANGETVAGVRQCDLGGFPKEQLPKGFPDISKLSNPKGRLPLLDRNGYDALFLVTMLESYRKIIYG